MHVNNSGEHVKIEDIGDGGDNSSFEDLANAINRFFPGVPHAKIKLYIDSNATLWLRSEQQPLQE